MSLSPFLSCIMNWARFVAAFVVVLGHSNMIGFSHAGELVGQYGHTMVILFFVMSGYIIARTTADARLDIGTFAILRASRVGVVALPALLLSWSVSVALLTLVPNAASIDETLYWPDAVDVLRNLLFADHFWVLGKGVSLNLPYWSLTYEVWYYLLFAMWWLGKGRVWKWAAALVFLMIGPALWVLMPVWLLGVWLARAEPPTFSRFQAMSIMLVALAVPVLVKEAALDLQAQAAFASVFSWSWRLGYSTKFLTDFVLGLSFCMFFWAAGALQMHVPEWLARWGTVLAGFSFSLYLFHDPLLRMVWILSGGRSLSLPEHAVLLVLIVLLCWLISAFTERRTGTVRRWLTDACRVRWRRP